MKECVTTSRVLVLVNGSPSEEFSPQRGLRQGDPLSPFLFNLVVEGLHMLLSRACELNLIKGVKVGCEGVVLTLLHFADDSLLFSEAEVEVVRKLKMVLRCFEIMSGMPLGANPRRLATWKPVVDKVKRVAKELEKLQANFLWGGSDSKRKIRMIKWEEMPKRIDQGGWGIRNLRDVNKCLQIKWWWRFGSEKDALWKKVICSRYKLKVTSWIPSLNSSNGYSAVWNGIISVAEQSSSLKDFYLHNFKLKVGDGVRIRFWSDAWCQSVCLKDELPTLYRLSLKKKECLRVLVDKKNHSKGLVS
ncbi:uncharacterized protein LOC114294466 [Camellia sinensis]|uniref:uncharacterized protein LOC114294466 n=1 Tax=Camellia sinensis TaxID=4442 RepID=UPI0010360E69|nr:uncharacterized protein LOC114294466 [Camellia sinensis]